MKNGVILHLVEHGQTHTDELHQVHGNRDDPLDAKGRLQARMVARRIAQLPKKPDHIDSSDRKRARQTAAIIGKATGLPVRTTPQLRGLDVGNFTGQNEKAVAGKLESFFAHPNRVIPGGESVSAWRRKHRDFIRARSREAAQEGVNPIIVTHSNTMGSIRAAAEGSEDGLKAMAHPPKNGSITNVHV